MSTPCYRSEIALSRLHWPVTTLGYGNRIGIWFQGCSIHCEGCCSQDTWEVTDEQVITIDSLLDWVALCPLDEVNGITISGGEPFDQPEALSLLVQRLRDLFDDNHKLDILVYSGYPWQSLQKKHAKLLTQFDVIISGPYQLRTQTAWLRGSDNQRIHCVTPLGVERYASPPSDIPKKLQIHIENNQLWMIGIPEKGDLEVLQSRLGQLGINLGDVSWRS